MKFLLTLFVLFGCFICMGQKIPLSASDKATLDSLLATDEFFKLMKDARARTSFFQLSAGIGNSYFSIKNKQLNASQLQNKLVLTTTAGYSHKSGLSIVASGFLFDHMGRSDFYQYSITPSYSYITGKTIDASLSYSHYLHRKGFENVASPIQHELYAYANMKTPWIQPGIGVGYATGKYTEYNKIDTVIFGIRRVFIDTAKTTLSDFSITGFIQHSFDMYNIFSKKDGLRITPQLLLNAGFNSLRVNHQNPYITKLQNRNPERFKNAGRFSDQSSLYIQSAAFNLGVSYALGNIGIQPQVYLDYYIPESTDKKLTAIYSVVVSYIFD